ncbi:MAG: hypothetical protein QM764_20950 [Chitinophagaceae bacterium]
MTKKSSQARRNQDHQQFMEGLLLPGKGSAIFDMITGGKTDNGRDFLL